MKKDPSLIEGQPSSSSRRNFIAAGLSLSAALAISPRTAIAQANHIAGFSPSSGTARPAPVSADSSEFWSHPRVLRLKHYKTGENFEAAYWRNGSLDNVGYAKACHLLRDIRQDITHPIDPRLFDLMCAMQAWVSFYGFKKPFLVTSGYRTQHTNQRLEGAARNSMHLKGKAVDLIVPELPVSYLGQLAQHYSAGGVGFYPSSGFVHVDTGRIRTWRRG